MKNTDKRRKPTRSLRQLADADLRTVAGAISFLGVEERNIIIYSDSGVGDGLRSSGG